jgi:hypothetical protein
MKQNIQVSGTVELNEEDLKRILLNHAKANEALMLTVIDTYLRKEHGISAKKITPVKSNGKLSIKVEVNAAPGKAAVSISKLKQPTTGFTKSNMGFARELARYFDDLKKGKKKSVAYAVALKHMNKVFPALTEKKFYVYIFNKRQWLKWGFSYDSKSKTFHF